MQQKPSKKLFWIFALSSAVYFTQGIESLPSQGLFYYLKETLHFSPEKIMIIASLTTFSWLVKPLIGYVIDSLLTKRLWVFISLALDIAFVLFLGFMQMPLIILVVLLILNSNNSAFRDVAVDGIMCVEGKKYQITGKIQSIQWASILIAGLFTGLGGAFIAEKWDYKVAFLSLIPVYLLVALPAYFYKEEKEAALPSSTLLKDLKRIFSDKKILIIGLFIFLYKYSPSFGTPLFFIQRDSFGWSKMWIGTLGTVSTVFGIAGSLLYYKFSEKINIKKWLYASVFIGAITTLSYLYYTPFTAIAYDVVYSLLGMFIFIMVMDFMARHSIKGLEATSFALLCSVNNLAGLTSNLSGAFLLPRVGLQWLIIISALTSFLCLFLINKIE
ncbi:MAG: MFS transporter [Candidatus Omnitrophica bacterium]|jgi:MFS-type transporter involved in bile tolerance (Atg22 family)|nr:MFS transporter [Candidatus Omnitrophota bacterium]